jgi:putative transcriptional regulator
MLWETKMRPEEIKALRDSLNMSQEEFARAFGLSFSTVSRWESGKSIPRREQECQLEALRELMQQQGVNRKKVAGLLSIAGIGGTVALGAVAGLGLLNPLGAAISAWAGGGVLTRKLRSLFTEGGEKTGEQEK